MKKLIKKLYKHEEILTDLMCNLLADSERNNKGMYNYILYEMYKHANGGELDECLAYTWVDSLEQHDGTVGEHWSIEETNAVKESLKLNYNCWTFYAVLNMIYADCYKMGADDTYYIELAKKWLNMKNKALKYYLFVVDYDRS